MQYLKLDKARAGVDANLVVVVDSNIFPSAVLGHVDEGQLIRRRSIVFLVAFSVLLYYYVMAKPKRNKHIEYV